ncbi:glycosyltransferase family 87 protein [Variovorax sp. J22R24]|uniref:glycosyltransferase family 87 protein n=1 Tax=Variovorax gracilis TaxID=3053502 RepID=UPI00257658D5|nr:glycosyltransferase family 87 protein [Variovorax sp. J22R24]MDM0107898.1 glycosyltransferase family 87 protein [Variovorax sp. J22R24]
MKSLLLFAIALLSGLALLALWRLEPPIPGLARNAGTDPHARTWRTWAMLQASGLLVCAIATLIDGLPAHSTMSYARFLLAPYAGTDSWMPMQRAVEQLQQHPDVPLYQSLFFEQHVKFQYPLTSLLLLDVPRWVFHADLDSVILFYKVLSRFCVIAIGVVFYMLMTGAIRAAHPDAQRARIPPLTHAVLLALSLFSVAMFYPIARSEAHGQIQTSLTLLAALALLAWQRDRPIAAGVLIAMCACVKPQWAFFVVWALFRREWKFAIAAALTGAVILGLALAAYGFDNVVGYLPVLSFLSRHGESYFINQSVNGLMHRLLFNGINLEGRGLLWSGTDIPPYHRIVHMATLASSALILGAAMFWRLRKRPTLIDMSLVMLSLTIASPVAWEHHYGVLFPIFAVMLPSVMQSRPFGQWTLPLFWLGFTLTSQSFVTLTNLFADSRLNVLQSYIFFGGLLVLAALYRMSWLEPIGGAVTRAGRASLQGARAAA